MNNNTESHDDLAHIETMNAEQLRDELRTAVAFHRECLVSNWHEKKELSEANGLLQSALENGMAVLDKAAKEVSYFNEVMDKAALAITMWKRTSYALALLVVALAIVIAKGVAA
jgi:hypothetical protein